MKRTTCVCGSARNSMPIPLACRCSSRSSSAETLQQRQQPTNQTKRSHGPSIAAIANIERSWVRLERWEWSGCGCGFALGSDTKRTSERKDLLLQPIHRVHHALKLGSIEQIECALFARKHFKRDAP